MLVWKRNIFAYTNIFKLSVKLILNVFLKPWSCGSSFFFAFQKSGSAAITWSLTFSTLHFLQKCFPWHCLISTGEKTHTVTWCTYSMLKVKLHMGFQHGTLTWGLTYSLCLHYMYSLFNVQSLAPNSNINQPLATLKLGFHDSTFVTWLHTCIHL